MDLLVKYHGFTIWLDNAYIKCNRQGTDKTKRAYVNGPLNAGCTFQFKIASLETERYMPADSTKQKWRYKKRWDRPIKIIDGCCTHGSACQPSKQNRVNTSQQAQKYMNNMPKSAIFTLCNYMENLGRLDSNLITNVMKPVWPRAKEFSKYDVFNVRVKVMRLLPVYRRSDGDYEQFKEVVNAGNLLDGIENEIDIDDDEAYEFAQSLWLEVVSTMDSKEGLFSFIKHRDLICLKAKGFTYKIAESPSHKSTCGHNKKLLGVIWQTATMRRNFELFGDFIGMDMMKRGINTLLWPYFSVTMYDEMSKICIACEGILCGEREDMYQFACDFLGAASPKRPLSEVKVVAGDGFFYQDLVRRLGFCDACYVADQWHLLDSGLKFFLGSSGNELLRGHLVNLVKAQSKAEFDSTLDAAFFILQNLIPRNGDLEAKLSDFAMRKTSYATYLIEEIPGNRGLHGNACSEQNNWSVISHLNPGVAKGGNTYCEHPITLIKDLMQRQKIRTMKTNQLLFGMCQKMRVELGQLKNEPQTALNQDLIKAASLLALPSYERYKRSAERALRDLVLHSDIDPTLQHPRYIIQSVRYPEAPPRVFQSKEQRCACKGRVRELDQFDHEILLRGGFDPSYFLERHFSRDCVKGSLSGWTNANFNNVRGILGCEDETIEDEKDSPSVNQHKHTSNIVDQASTTTVTLPMKTSLRVKPLTKKQVSNILTAVCGAYSSFSEEQQFEISNLALQLQEVICLDKSRSDVVVHDDKGMFLEVPNADARMNQCKKRAQPIHEIQANVASKKIQKSLQNIGLSQDVSNDLCSIQVNGNYNQIVHCKFCSLGHMITNCPRCNELKLCAYEYQLSTSSEQDMDNLRQRVRSSLFPKTGAVIPHESEIFGVVSSNLQSKNFILHHIHEIGTSSVDVIENRVYCVSFLSGNGMEDPLWNKKWIMGKILNQLITHKNKTKKYVYDETALQYSLTDEMTGDNKTDSELAENECQLETSMM